MYERFTDRARKVMQMANQAAQKLNHEYIGTEHILLGLLREGGGVASKVLPDASDDIEKDVLALLEAGPDMVTMGKLPQTPRANKVIEFAMEEARNLNHNYVGTEHILIGLLKETEGIASTVLTARGMTLTSTREQIVKLLTEGTKDGGASGDALGEELKTALRQVNQTWSVMVGVPKRMVGSGLFVIRSTDDQKYWTVSDPQWVDSVSSPVKQSELAFSLSVLANHETFRPFEVVELML